MVCKLIVPGHSSHTDTVLPKFKILVRASQRSDWSACYDHPTTGERVEESCSVIRPCSGDYIGCIIILLFDDTNINSPIDVRLSVFDQIIDRKTCTFALNRERIYA